jgi:cyclopropane-fatty-acyl-phospholipid synthase
VTTIDVRPSIAIDAQQWPDVVNLPAGGLRSVVAAFLLKRAVRTLPLRVQLPNGSQYGAGDDLAPVLRIRRLDAMARRIGATGTIGFGEAYLAGDWETDDLVGVLTAFASNVGTLIPLPLQKLRHQILSRMPSIERNTVQGSATNISRHYDLSNDMFATFLDETMTYSAALFEGTTAAPQRDGALVPSQHRKIDRLLDAARVGPGTRLLEIGTGWGELALRAAARGAQVHSVTISAEQASLARQRIAAAGLSDRVEVELVDYRQVTGTYDAIVSVEMIEAVGLDHVHEYFAALDRHLAPGGRIALQAITMPDDRMRATQDTYTWIRKYVFPGGQILSIPAIEDAVRAHTSLEVSDHFAFGLHYAETLRQWRIRFRAHESEIASLNFDSTFRRMWEYYLAYSEAGFRSGYLDVYQLVLTRKAGA